MLDWDAIRFGSGIPPYMGFPKDFQINRGKFICPIFEIQWIHHAHGPLLDMHGKKFKIITPSKTYFSHNDDDLDNFLEQHWNSSSKKKLEVPEVEKEKFFQYKQKGFVVPQDVLHLLELTSDTTETYLIWFDFQKTTKPDLTSPGNSATWNEFAFYVPVKLGQTIQIGEQVWRIDENEEVILL